MLLLPHACINSCVDTIVVQRINRYLFYYLAEDDEAMFLALAIHFINVVGQNFPSLSLRSNGYQLILHIGRHGALTSKRPR